MAHQLLDLGQKTIHGRGKHTPQHLYHLGEGVGQPCLQIEEHAVESWFPRIPSVEFEVTLQFNVLTNEPYGIDHPAHFLVNPLRFQPIFQGFLLIESTKKSVNLHPFLSASINPTQPANQSTYMNNQPKPTPMHPRFESRRRAAQYRIMHFIEFFQRINHVRISIHNFSILGKLHVGRVKQLFEFFKGIGLDDDLQAMADFCVGVLHACVPLFDVD
ncbi:MAG: hypothetical protein Q9216_004504 [Gyalolechia sp. 2 TL-2023]